VVAYRHGIQPTNYPCQLAGRSALARKDNSTALFAIMFTANIAKFLAQAAPIQGRKVRRRAKVDRFQP